MRQRDMDIHDPDEFALIIIRWRSEQAGIQT
jgi:hypothetical protein